MGKNHLGNTFGMAFSDYNSIIATPFQQFLRGVYRVFFVVIVHDTLADYISSSSCRD
jgi:hypothetical protein